MCVCRCKHLERMCVSAYIGQFNSCFFPVDDWCWCVAVPLCMGWVHVGATLDDVSAGVVFVFGATEVQPGIHTAVVLDPNGIRITLVSSESCQVHARTALVALSVTLLSLSFMINLSVCISVSLSAVASCFLNHYFSPSLSLSLSLLFSFSLYVHSLCTSHTSCALVSHPSNSPSSSCSALSGGAQLGSFRPCHSRCHRHYRDPTGM